jgi:hypothetical protein
MINFGEWLPDQPDYNGGTTQARNVIPAARGYRPFPRPTSLSNQADNYIRGVFASQDNDFNYDIYVGDEQKLYRYNTDGSLNDVSRAGGYNSSLEERWEFTQYGERLIAANYTDNLQTLADSSTGSFSDLVSIKARYITVANEFLVLGFVNDTDGQTPYRVRWSAIGDPTDFTVSSTTQSDFQDIPDGGAITGLVGGEDLTVLMENQIVRATYAGTPLIWQFDATDQQRGCAFPGAYANIGRIIYFLSDDGFYRYDGNASQPIGAERVDRWFFDHLNRSFTYRISVGVDPLNQTVAWAFPSVGSGDGTPDTILLYNYAVDKWSYVQTEVDVLNRLFTAGYSLEDLDSLYGSLEDVDASLDSAQFEGGQLFFGGGKNNRIVSFAGTPLNAVMETPEFEVTQGRHGLMTEVHPYVQGAPDTLTVQVASRLRKSDTIAFNGASALNDADFCPVRSQGRYHRIRMNVTGDQWQHAYGVSHVTRRMGRR